MNYYNENDLKTAAWLRELISGGLIAPGIVDERSICEVKECDLRGFTQCHFFAGIGGWPFALRLAGWPDSRPVWSGSCPCQPFSLNGHQGGFDDPRDLWPTWFRLIEKRQPDCIFGEQVDGSLEWIDRAAADLETINYAFAPASIPACAVRARHERQRLYFAAYSTALYGGAHDRLEPCGIGGSSAQFGGLPSLHVAGRWWEPGAGSERLPTLVRNFDGLSTILGGFGNAIVPQLAAEFIQAAEEALRDQIA